MPYFIRLADAKHIEDDLARGFSCWLGDMDLEDAAFHAGLLDDCDGLLSEYDGDLEELEAEVLESGFAKYGKAYRAYHHEGLSCHIIPANISLESVGAWFKQNSALIGHGCDHEVMFNAQWVMSLNPNVHVFYADEWGTEGAGSNWNNYE